MIVEVRLSRFLVAYLAIYYISIHIYKFVNIIRILIFKAQRSRIHSSNVYKRRPTSVYSKGKFTKTKLTATNRVLCYLVRTVQVNDSTSSITDKKVSQRVHCVCIARGFWNCIKSGVINSDYARI